ncbi:hypothetical protein PoB_006737300 [Plakobranchus ocellatus]|uniref:Nanos-type domain-containing protein n=1 Tax=Plakobranchus ocellatus TaxID=259542 RepID=A0AAV4D9Y0_9GAST|nr:hypothetical protein PoB_006737300 [Plakobranchus ocellatus]
MGGAQLTRHRRPCAQCNKLRLPVAAQHHSQKSCPFSSLRHHLQQASLEWVRDMEIFGGLDIVRRANSFLCESSSESSFRRCVYTLISLRKFK